MVTSIKCPRCKKWFSESEYDNHVCSLSTFGAYGGEKDLSKGENQKDAFEGGTGGGN